MRQVRLERGVVSEGAPPARLRLLLEQADIDRAACSVMRIACRRHWDYFSFNDFTLAVLRQPIEVFNCCLSSCTHKQSLTTVLKSCSALPTASLLKSSLTPMNLSIHALLGGSREGR